MLNPVDPLYAIKEIYERLSNLEGLAQRIATGLMGVRLARGAVTATGGTQCTVLLSDGLTSVTKGYLTSYTPTVGHQVLLVFSPIWSGVLGQVSV